MADECWNDDIAYGFSIHRIILEMAGMWPLQKRTVFVWIRWVMVMIAQCMIPIFLVKDIIDSKDNIGANLECILFFAFVTITLTKTSCITYYQKKLAINIKFAVRDWLSIKNNEETRKIMKKYTIKTRILTLIMFYGCTVCYSAYVFAIVVMDLRQTFSNPINADTNKTNLVFLVPSGELSSTVTGSQYMIIIIIQIYQIFLMCYIQCALDGFYFGIVLHLVGQLELFKKVFTTVIIQSDTRIHYRRRFISLISKHSELIKLNQNLQDSYQTVILITFVIVTCSLALLGLRINWCLSEKNYFEALKSFLLMNYLILESSVYSYGGDFLQTESEDIFYTLYTTSWFTLPAALMKDLHFMMMRSSIPFRLSGGKFFYINRETMIYMLKSAASYVSVLRVAIKG